MNQTRINEALELLFLSKDKEIAALEGELRVVRRAVRAAAVEVQAHITNDSPLNNVKNDLFDIADGKVIE